MRFHKSLSDKREMVKTREIIRWEKHELEAPEKELNGMEESEDSGMMRRNLRNADFRAKIGRVKERSLPSGEVR